jgi:hypothetical protein
MTTHRPPPSERLTFMLTDFAEGEIKVIPWYIVLEKLTVAKFINILPAFCWNSKVHSRTQKTPSSAPIVGQMNPACTLTHCFLNKHFNIISSSTRINEGNCSGTSQLFISLPDYLRSEWIESRTKISTSHLWAHYVISPQVQDRVAARQRNGEAQFWQWTLRGTATDDRSWSVTTSNMRSPENSCSLNTRCHAV